MLVQLFKTFSFEAAHHHPGDPGPGGRIHGHSFRVEALLKGEVDPQTGWLVDFADIKRSVQGVLAAIDHRYLNEIEGLQSPSPESIAEWVRVRARESLDHELIVRIQCREVTIPVIEQQPPESPGKPGRVSLRFEAAHFLPETPPDHKCRRLHGHSYRLEIETPNPDQATDPLQKLFARVDHRNLNELEGLDNPTAELLCLRFWSFLRAEGLELRSLFISETCESGCYFFG